MAATYDGDGNRTFQLNRQVIPFSIEKSELSDNQDSEVGESVGGTANSETTISSQNDTSALQDTIGVKQDEVYTYYEKVYVDPEDSIFWYGFGQGTVQFFANINTSLGAYLSDWFCQAWDAITSEYELVLHSEAVYSEEDIEAMRNAGLSEEEIVEITGCEVDKNGEFMLECDNSKSQEELNASSDKKEASKPKEGVTIIPSNPDEVTRIDYDLTYYVNDINTANTQVLMTYGRNQTEKAVYVYGEERIAEDDLQTEETSDYLYDGRGSVVQTVIDMEINMSLTYDPFGEITSGADENFVGYAYNGEESNEVTGLQYLRARYYDTELGSFITIDTYLGSLDNAISQNRYTYANNDPVNNIDPSGHYSVNVNGTSQYYQTTGLNELRDYMTAAALWAGQVTAQSSFNGSVARASNTSFMNYQSITGISQSTANNYINKGIAQAGQVSMNYGCSVPTVPNQAVAKFSNNVNAAKNSANARISSIKAQKKTQYDDYQAYLRWAEEQKRIEEQLNRYNELVSKLSKLDIKAGIKVKEFNGIYYYDYTDVVMNRMNEDMPEFEKHRIITYEDYVEKYSLKLFGKWIISVPSYNEYLGTVAGNFWYFYDEVNHGAPWDIKRDGPWEEQFGDIRMPAYDGENSEKFLFRDELVTREDLGNITYGYLGSAMGIGDVTLFWGGGVAKNGMSSVFSDKVRDASQYYGDDENDHIAIQKGVDFYYDDYPNAKPGINRTLP